jgi:hypothetical protein
MFCLLFPLVLYSYLGGEVVNRKRLVIMDEVDGMGGSDRGGIAELIKVQYVRCWVHLWAVLTVVCL